MILKVSCRAFSTILLTLFFIIYLAPSAPASTPPSTLSSKSEAGQAVEILRFDSDSLRDRYYGLIDNLRCPKCQNQNLADSDAPIAEDLRNQLHSLLQEGKSDTEILDFMTARYGTFVLYEPPVNLHTVILWGLPAVLIPIGLYILFTYTRGGKKPAAPDREQSSANDDFAFSGLMEGDTSHRRASGAERVTIVLSGIAVLLVAYALYASWGYSLGANDQLRIRQQLDELTALRDPRQAEQQIDQLRVSLEQYNARANPDEEISFLLAELYRSAGEYDKQAEVLDRLMANEAESPALMVARAEALYLDHLGRSRSAENLPDEILRLLENALQLQPEFPKALSLSGIVAFQQQQWKKAIHYLERAEILYPPGSEQAATMRRGIASAQAQLGAGSETAAGSEKSVRTAIKLRVSASMDDAVNIDPATPVFVFARAVSGPPMPLAARKLSFADLPVDIVLTEGDAMTAATIAGHNELKVGARLAFSGQPLPRAGDYESADAVVTTMQLDESSTEKERLEQLAAMPVTVLQIDTMINQ